MMMALMIVGVLQGQIDRFQPADERNAAMRHVGDSFEQAVGGAINSNDPVPPRGRDAGKDVGFVPHPAENRKRA